MLYPEYEPLPLLQQYRLNALPELWGQHQHEVYAGWYFTSIAIPSVPDLMVIHGLQIPIHQPYYLPAEQNVNRQVNISCSRQVEPEGRGGIERIQVVLMKSLFDWYSSRVGGSSLCEICHNIVIIYYTSSVI